MKIGTVTMQNIIRADHSMKQITVANNAKTQMEGRANVLTAEIKQDKSSGSGNTERKEAELAELKDKAEALGNDLMARLSDINEEMKNNREESIREAKEARRADKKADKKADDKSQRAERKNGAEKDVAAKVDVAGDGKETGDGATANPHLVAGTMETYVSVDVKL